MPVHPKPRFFQAHEQVHIRNGMSCHDLPPTNHPKFRAGRLRQEDLGPVRVEVIIHIGERKIACALHDVSTSGVAFELPASLDLNHGARLTDLAVVSDEHEFYHGSAVIRTIRKVDGHKVAGASFLDSPMNMDDVLQLRAVRERRTDPRLLHSPDEQPWHCGDPRGHHFQALVAELHLFLNEAEAHFNSLERELPWHVVHGEKVTPARQALIQQLEDGFVPSFVHYTEIIDAALRETPPENVDSLKAFSRALIQDTFMRAPLMHRCLTKPLGYPGDYVIMRYLYEDRFEGPTLWAKALHLAGTSVPSGQAVRARKDMILETSTKIIRERAERGKRTRILSVAAGPAQDTVELIRHNPELAGMVDVLLYDQDRDALEFVNNRINFARAIAGPACQTANVHLRHDTIKRLLEDDRLFQDFGPVDIVHVVGLFDYLRFHTGVKLIQNLYRTLRPGGKLLAGNFSPDQPTRWVFDLHLDWFIEYRNREQILAMGEAAEKHGQPRIVEECTGWNPFIELTRS